VNPAALALLWAIVSVDGALMGYRLAMGRDARIDKRRYHRRRARRALGLVQPALAAVTLAALVLIATGPAGTGGAFDAALCRLLTVVLPYAACFTVTTAVCLLPSVTARTAASIVIFGPFTLLRPVVLAAAVAYAVVPDPRWPLVAVGLTVLLPGVALEPVANRRVRDRVLRPEPGELSPAAFGNATLR
jgi:hypothetical protein